jgi:translation initiation factor 4G
VELATSPVEIVINEVNSEALSAMGAEVDAQWGKKPDQPADSSAAAEQPSKGDKDWNEKKTTDAAKTTNAKAGGKKGGKVDLTPLPEGTDGATIVKAANAWSRGGGATTTAPR